ncbi:hypothetical protein B0H34DRAFT_785117 [Crassisporium funariophilum]|nr:hypothetical protein B0H34DRAFT_785117 [Crassisporium funariophilum]
MHSSVIPSIDENNPLYCPAVPAALYLKSLRCRSRQLAKSHHDLDLFQSYARVLEQQSSHSNSEGSSGEEGDIGSDWILGNYVTAGRGRLSGRPRQRDTLPPYYSHSWASNCLALGQGDVENMEATQPYNPSRKRKFSLSDLGAPPKYARSQPSIHDSSFDIEVRREKLNYLDAPSSPSYLKKNSSNPVPGVLSIGVLVDRLVSLLPSIRLQERLVELTVITADSIMKYLADNGHVHQRVLQCFQESDIKEISFASFASDENGLNLCARELYTVFSFPNSFLFLSELSFSGIRVHDFDLLHIQHLSRLAILLLNETGIGNEAVFLLVSLKRTLVRLSLAANPHVDDDAIPAIVLLSKLSFLSILDTGIEMGGLRRLASIIVAENRFIDIEIPFSCEAYIDGIHSKYLYHPLPPLITNHRGCPQLSEAALKRNLEAHAACNPSIVTSGTRPEMISRLSEILKTRKLDIIVKDMLDGNESDCQNFGSL